MAIRSSGDCPNCGSNHKGKPFAIYEDGYHCFSCGYHKSSERNFSIPVRKLESDVKLPSPLEVNPRKFSIPVQKYLFRYFVTYEQITKFRIMEAPEQSIIFPVFYPKTDKIVYYTRRYIGDIRKRFLGFGSKKTPFNTKNCTALNSDNHPVLVIVEDYVSAVRVSSFADGYCCFGTSVNYYTLQNLIREYDTILVWLDGDKAGQRGASKIIKNLSKLRDTHIMYRAFGNLSRKNIQNVTTELDPKCYTNSQLKDIIHSHIEAHEKGVIDEEID